MNKENIFEEIVNECFWDVKLDKSEVEKIIKGNDIKKKKYIFEKILLNSKDPIKFLSIFKKDELKNFLYSYKPNFRIKKIQKRINILKKIFLNDNVKIESLEWEYRDI